MPNAPADSFRFSCPRCGARLKASTDQRGTACKCPKCDTQLRVPEPGQWMADDEYEVREGSGQSPESDRDAQPTYVPVICPLCQTRMYATPHQVGETIECPDCGTGAEVVDIPPRPAKTGRGADLQEVGEPYELYDGVDQPPSDDTIVYGDYTLVHCPLCQTQMQVPVAKVGETMACPDCGSPVPVTRQQARKRPKTLHDFGAPLEVCEPEVLVRPTVTPFVSDLERDAADPSDEGTAEPDSAPSGPPPYFLLGGDVWPKWFGSALAGAAVLAFAIEAIRLGSGPVGKAWVFALLFTVLTGVVGLIWMVTLSVHCLAILQAAAVGSDRQIDWPDAVWIDWVLECLYVINAVAVSGLSGWALARSLQWAGYRADWVIEAVGFVLFPIVLLSMLEAGSAMTPVSSLVFRSLWVSWKTWLLFYVLAFAMAGVVVVPIGLALAHEWTWLAALVSPLLIANLMIYFRQLGRLAHQGAAQLAALQPPDEGPVDEPQA